MPTLYSHYLPFSSLFALYDVSNCKIRCQSVKGITFQSWRLYLIVLILNDIIKTKLTILALLCCEEILKNSTWIAGDGSQPTCGSSVDTVIPSILVLYKVGNTGIFVQLLVEIKQKQWIAKSVSMKIYIYHSALNYNWSDWFLYPSCFQK